MSEPEEKPHLSPTQIDTATKCPEAYRRRYILGQKIPPKIVMLQGRGVHGAAQANFTQKIETHEDIPPDDIVEIAVEQFRHETSTQEYQLSADEVAKGHKRALGDATDQVAQLANLHAWTQARDYQPIVNGVERKAVIILPNATHDILGYIDLVTDQGIIPDFKTVGRAFSQDDADASVQLTYYAAAYQLEFGKPPEEVRLDMLVKTKTPKRAIVRSKRGPRDFRAFVNRVNSVLAMIQSGVFPPTTPGAWWCSAKWCGYHATCPYVNAQPHVFEIGGLDEQTEEMPEVPGQDDDRAREASTVPEVRREENDSVSHPAATPRLKSYKMMLRALWRLDPHCRWCGKTLKLKHSTVDHIVPLARGGANDWGNYCLACADCNHDRADSGLTIEEVHRRKQNGKNTTAANDHPRERTDLAGGLSTKRTPDHKPSRPRRARDSGGSDLGAPLPA